MSTGSPASHSLRSRSHDALTPTRSLAEFFPPLLGACSQANSRFGSDTLLNRANFINLFQFIYFDLTKQPTDIKDGMTKLTFKYELSGATAAAYSVYSLILHEQDIEIRKTDGKLTLRST